MVGEEGEEWRIQVIEKGEREREEGEGSSDRARKRCRTQTMSPKRMRKTEILIMPKSLVSKPDLKTKLNTV